MSVDSSDEKLGFRGTGRTLASALRAIATAVESGYCHACDHQIDGNTPTRAQNEMFQDVIDRLAVMLKLQVRTYFTADNRLVVQSLYKHSQWKDREQDEQDRKRRESDSIAQIKAEFRRITGKELVLEEVS